jgi:hypothetical protein
MNPGACILDAFGQQSTVNSQQARTVQPESISEAAAIESHNKTVSGLSCSQFIKLIQLWFFTVDAGFFGLS